MHGSSFSVVRFVLLCLYYKQIFVAMVDLDAHHLTFFLDIVINIL